MEDFAESSYDENDIEDFEEYLHYYRFDDGGYGDDEEEETPEDEIKELYF